MPDDTQIPSGINPRVATAARMYDYFLGGHENFAADRIAALKVIEAAPEAPILAKENRKFLGRAVRHLAGGRGSPQTVETSVVVIMASMAGLLAPVPGWGQAWPARLFLVPGAAVVSGVKGGPQGRRAPARCGAPLRPEGRPRTLSGREKASGGAAASFSRPAQRARRAHAASFPARDRS